MSLSTLARDEMLRRNSTLREIQQPRIELARATIATRLGLNEAQTAPLGQELTDLATAQPVQETQATSALDSLVKYIPTESITLYVATIAALGALTALSGNAITATEVYWAFGILTPILFLLIYAGKRRSNGLPPLPSPREFPWWKLIASTIAFLTWALAVPGGPYLQGDAGGPVAALAALFISTLLSVLAAVIEKPES